MRKNLSVSGKPKRYLSMKDMKRNMGMTDSEEMFLQIKTPHNNKTLENLTLENKEKVHKATYADKVKFGKQRPF